MKGPKRKNFLFRKVTSQEEAQFLLNDVAKGLQIIAWWQFGLGFFYGTYLWVDSILIFIGSGLMRRYQSRPAALCLFFLTINTMIATLHKSSGAAKVGATHIILAVLMLWWTVRGVEAAFRYHGRFPAPTPSTIPPPLPPPALG